MDGKTWKLRSIYANQNDPHFIFYSDPDKRQVDEITLVGGDPAQTKPLQDMLDHYVSTISSFPAFLASVTLYFLDAD